MEDIRTKDHKSRSIARRHYSAHFKAQIVSQTGSAGVSVASVALQHRINPVTVHRWIREARATQTQCVAPFIPLHLTPEPALQAPSVGDGATIQIELQRTGTTIRIQWPVVCAAECAAWIREVLK
jgi:transposase